MSNFNISVRTYNLPTRLATPPQNLTPKASGRKSLVRGQIMLVNKIYYVYFHQKSGCCSPPRGIKWALRENLPIEIVTMIEVWCWCDIRVLYNVLPLAGFRNKIINMGHKMLCTTYLQLKFNQVLTINSEFNWPRIVWMNYSTITIAVSKSFLC